MNDEQHRQDALPQEPPSGNGSDLEAVVRAEQRGYSKGYQAGKRRKEREISEGARQRKNDAFWTRAFLAMLPATFNAQNWTRGEEKIISLKDRVRLAAEAADEALKHAEFRL